MLGLTILHPTLNITLTALTLKWGATWFGYGFAVSMLITVLIGVWILKKELDMLEYRTFMLQ